MYITEGVTLLSDEAKTLFVIGIDQGKPKSKYDFNEFEAPVFTKDGEIVTEEYEMRLYDGRISISRYTYYKGLGHNNDGRPKRGWPISLSKTTTSWIISWLNEMGLVHIEYLGRTSEVYLTPEGVKVWTGIHNTLSLCEGYRFKDVDTERIIGGGIRQ